MKSNRFFLLIGLCALVAVTLYANYKLKTPEENKFAAVESYAEEEYGEDISAMPQATNDPALMVVNNNAELSASAQNYDGAQSIQENITDDDYFATFKGDRDNVREKEIAYLDTIVTEASTDEATRKEAQQQKIDLVSSMEKEVIIEGLLKAKGFNNVAVTVNKGSVNVVVPSDGLEETQVAQILDIAQRESGEPAENIKVMPKTN